MTWLALSWPYVLELTGEHLLLSVPAVLLSVLIAIPIGQLANRRPTVGGFVLGAASLMYAIPALPLLIIIPVVFGFPLRSPATVITALTVYGTALLVRTAADAFGSVDAEVRAAALAVGHSPRGVFWHVDLPLAVPVLLSGVRVVAVSTVSLVTIGALIGVPSLGSLLTDGFQRGITEEVMVGVVATILVALVLDGLLILTGSALAPWARRRSPRPKILGATR
ncbi:ABC transporter permease [Glycomyces buryatensis]|uniref:ABC transporter permease n=1 Tax=Glycomyces buryatensis TaxID=2570927 RepID=A0A4S8QM55_9ACTN|nr:ABC transporter permease [Glycomyces buryatensis]THV41814.1 ABC transporter permease [Glycomyces buryatensis]